LKPIETTLTEYAEQIKRLVILSVDVPLKELARRLNKTEQFMIDRLNLAKIDDPKIKRAIDNGEIRMPNAFLLAKHWEKRTPQMIKLSYKSFERFVAFILTEKNNGRL